MHWFDVGRSFRQQKSILFSVISCLSGVSSRVWRSAEYYDYFIVCSSIYNYCVSNSISAESKKAYKITVLQSGRDFRCEWVQHAPIDVEFVSMHLRMSFCVYDAAALYSLKSLIGSFYIGWFLFHIKILPGTGPNSITNCATMSISSRAVWSTNLWITWLLATYVGKEWYINYVLITDLRDFYTDGKPWWWLNTNYAVFRWKEYQQTQT